MNTSNGKVVVRHNLFMNEPPEQQGIRGWNMCIPNKSTPSKNVRVLTFEIVRRLQDENTIINRIPNK